MYAATIVVMEKDPELLKNIALNIRKFRHEKNLSQEDLAELAGVHRTYIGMLERAEKNVTVLSLAQIAHALDHAIQDFFEEGK